MIKQRNDAEQAKALDRLPELTEEESRSVTGGCNNYHVYYDIETCNYIAVHKDRVFYRPGTLLVC